MGATGTANLDFGTSGQITDTFVDVAVAGVLTTSAVEAWIQVPAAATADHQSDEYWVENLSVYGGCLVNGTIRVFGKCTLGSTNGVFVVQWVWN